jgi:multicomponent Na+:H+ antiporter subunit E
VLYANSITLTPGTVTIKVDAEGFEVHALTEEGAAGLEAGEMARRVAHIEGLN